jgi:hypothetical protein
MRKALQYIADQRAVLAGHVFLVKLGAGLPLDSVVPFIPAVSFFVLAFQDIMRMTGERASDPRLRDLLRRHCEEEVGHERWFFHDVRRLSGALPDLVTVFGKEHAPTRHATYALTSQVLEAENDIERLCLIFALEAAAEVCFGRAQAYFEQAGVAHDLVYFAGAHREAEQAHSAFDEEMQAIVAGITLDDVAYAGACRAVDRTFHAMRALLNGLAVIVAGTQPSP